MAKPTWSILSLEVQTDTDVVISANWNCAVGAAPGLSGKVSFDAGIALAGIKEADTIALVKAALGKDAVKDIEAAAQPAPAPVDDTVMIPPPWGAVV